MSSPNTYLNGNNVSGFHVLLTTHNLFTYLMTESHQERPLQENEEATSSQLVGK